MKRLALVAATWIAAGIGIAAQQPVVKGQSTSVTATVEAIDKTNREVTLKTEDGRLVTAEVDPAVKRFDAIKVGDRLTVTYYETMVFRIAKPGEPAATAGDTTVLTPSPGEKPRGTYARQRKATVTVEEIDPTTPSLTVRGDQGRVLTFRIAEPKNIEGLKKGDRIEVTYTEAYLVKVEPPAK